MKLLEEIESGSLCSLASHARLRIDSLEPRQRLLHDISQLIVGERAILFEREKRAEAQHECCNSAAWTIKLNRHASFFDPEISLSA
jgi:hypothetical protein